MNAPDALIARTGAYVEEVLGMPLELAPTHAAENLPFYLRDRYAFFEGDLLGRRCLFLLPADTDELEAPAALAKQFQRVANQTSATVVLLLPSLAAYNRKRLIAQRVNFIVVGAQLFLPELALDLRDHYRQAAPWRRPDIKTLSPTAQMIVIDAILRPRLHGLIAKAIAELLGVSAMTVGRAMEELRATDFAAMEAHGPGYRLYFRAGGRELWEAARPLLTSPVRKVRSAILVPAQPGVLLAGESALAQQTSLAEPTRTTYAVHDKDWKVYFDDRDIQDAAVRTPFLVESWAYAPSPLALGDGRVDPLSLYLSLNLNDERLDLATDELLETVFA